MSFTHRLLAGFVSLAGLSLIVIGCSDRGSTKPVNATQAVTTITKLEQAESQSPKPVATEDATEHGHKAGTHGGIIVSLGRDSFHAEAVFEKGGVLRLYMLGNDESRVIDIEQQTLKAFAKVEGDNEAQPFVFEPQPQDGDASGKTSQFVGQLPEAVVGRQLDVTIPNIVVAGERFRVGFKSAAEAHADSMPAKATSDEEQRLFLTAGGLYTESDVAANGRTTAAAKFKAVTIKHDAKPILGDKICPISMTKANPQIAWTIGGQKYEFCCPPCVEEFVRNAKTTKAPIQPAAEFVKK